MNLNRQQAWKSLLAAAIGLCVGAHAPPLHANVYATNIRINGGTTNITAAAGDLITISYLLNEPASLGATLQIRSGNTLVRSLNLPAEGQGTLRGFNSVAWDTSTAPVPSGTYSIAVVARSSGYTNWTQITSDTTDPNTYVFDGRGIAVDRNAGSAYYGRIFVSNGSVGFNPSTTPGDTVGILKFNADTSDAEEGISSADTSGHDWLGGGVSPWKLEVSADDFVYVNDLGLSGQVFRWDPTISSNSLLPILRQDNQPPNAALSGLAITGTGASTEIWMSDTNQARIFKWNVTPNLDCATNDAGALVVSNTGSNFFDVAVAPSGDIYTCTYITAEGDHSPRVFRYHAPSNSSAPETNADWAVGAGDDTYAGATGVAVDPTGSYVAVSFEGPVSGGLFSTNGNTKILWATNGAVAANLDLGLFIQNDPTHDDTGCAWDAVGNVYYIDGYWSHWRAVSPPGTNQATTTALTTIEITGGTTGGGPIQIIRLSVNGKNVNIDFSGDASDSTGSFVIQGSSTVNGSYSDVTTAVITQTGPGLFHATFPLSSTTQYFRIARTGVVPPPPTGPVFTKTALVGSNLVLTFSGASSDTPGSFTLFSSSVVNGNYTQVANPNIIQVSPGVFQATVPLTGAKQFYRVRK